MGLNLPRSGLVQHPDAEGGSRSNSPFFHPCPLLIWSVDVAKPSVQGLLVDSLGFWVQWGMEVSHVSPH